MKYNLCEPNLQYRTDVRILEIEELDKIENVCRSSKLKSIGHFHVYLVSFDCLANSNSVSDRTFATCIKVSHE